MKIKRIYMVLALIAALAFFLVALLHGLSVDVDAESEEYKLYKTYTEPYLHDEWLEDPEDPLEPIHIIEAIEEAPNRYDLTDDEFDLICGVVMAEAGGEPYEGQLAVAQCILNACDREGKRPAATIKALRCASPRSEWTESVACAVRAVFFEGETVTPENIIWWKNPAKCGKSFHDSQRMVIEIAHHCFYAPAE